jgi:hypothetical protein
LISCVMCGDIVSGVCSIVEVVSSHSSLSVLLVLFLLICHVSWLPLVVHSLGSVVILRMVAKSEMRFSKILLRRLI